MFNAQVNKDALIEAIKKFFAENGPTCNAIIGISGGKDSTVAAALCVEALGRDRVIGVLMPNGEQSDIDDSYQVVSHLGIRYLCVNIGESIGLLKNEIEKACFSEGLSQQTIINLPPRIRMATLYAVAQTMNGRVINTSNYSETYIGYSTRWGDSVGDYSPLGYLLSDEVVAIGDLCDLPYELVHKTPSDGLCGMSDEDRFGFSYEDLNNFIRSSGYVSEEAVPKIIEMHKKSEFKRSGTPTFMPLLRAGEEK